MSVDLVTKGEHDQHHTVHYSILTLLSALIDELRQGTTLTSLSVGCNDPVPACHSR